MDFSPKLRIISNYKLLRDKHNLLALENILSKFRCGRSRMMKLELVSPSARGSHFEAPSERKTKNLLINCGLKFRELAGTNIIFSKI